MMNLQSYLIVSLDGLQYALDAKYVQEIFLLPELEPILEAPTDIVGLLNLRSQLLPVMHLGVRLGVTADRCTLSDSVVVIRDGQTQVGVIVHAVHDVQSIDTDCIESDIPYGRSDLAKPRWLAGVAKLPTAMLMLLNIPQLIASADMHPPSPPEVAGVSAMAVALQAQADVSEAASLEAIPQLKAVAIPSPPQVIGFYDRWCPQATDAQKVIFQERAVNLRQSLADDTETQLIPLAIIRLNTEYFGFDLDRVREFAPIPHITTIPCCPSYIVGNINLRGEIVTLVDLHHALNLAMPTEAAAKVMVVQVDDIVAGIPVDEVVDVMHLSPEAMMSAPVAVRSQQQEYLRGTAQYGDRLLSVVDLSQLMRSGALIVNETN